MSRDSKMCAAQFAKGMGIGLGVGMAVGAAAGLMMQPQKKARQRHRGRRRAHGQRCDGHDPRYNGLVKTRRRKYF